MGFPKTDLWNILGVGIAVTLMIKQAQKQKLTLDSAPEEEELPVDSEPEEEEERPVKADFGVFSVRLKLFWPDFPNVDPGCLAGLSFAASDVFDIIDAVTGFGNPDWCRTHGPASLSCNVVDHLLNHGAKCVGKTVVDDMALGVSGVNQHYGTPTNPTAHRRLPGGASSGAAVAVAAEIVDFSLGIDTDGGVRLPAGNCGVLGFRPSHGSISLRRVIPVSQSLDTVGWFAKHSSMLRLVGQLLLNSSFIAACNPRTIVIADDCFQLLNIHAYQAIEEVMKSIEKHYESQVLRHINLSDYIKLKVPSLETFSAVQANGDGGSSPLRLLANVMQMLKRYEFRRNHNEWINSVNPTFDPAISAQISEVLLTDADIQNCRTIMRELGSAMNALLQDDGILVIPTATDPPPKLDADEIFSEEYLIQASTLSSVATMSGCCEGVLPLRRHKKCPVSLSFLAGHGGDKFLLGTLHSLYTCLQDQFDKTMTNEACADMFNEKGNLAFEEKDWQRAIGFYTEAIKLNGSNATYYCNRAKAYIENGSNEDCEADCSNAIDLDEKNLGAHVTRGLARAKLRRNKEDLKNALALDPYNRRRDQSFNRLKQLFRVR